MNFYLPGFLYVAGPSASKEPEAAAFVRDDFILTQVVGKV